MRYRPVVGGRALIGIALVLATFILAISAPGAIADGNGLSIALLLATTAALAWNLYWWIFRVAFDLRISAGRLDARGIARHWNIPLDDLTRIRPWGPLGGIVAFEIADARPIIVVATKGLRAFTDAISMQRAELNVDRGAVAELFENLPGWSRTDDD